MTDQSKSFHSTYRERVVEHLFLGELLSYAWAKRRRIEVLRPESDRDGYDLVVECGSAHRHIQLKALSNDGARAEFKLNDAFLNRQGACAIVILDCETDHALQIAGYRFYERANRLLTSSDGQMLSAKNSSVIVKLNEFFEQESIVGIAGRLFPRSFA